MSNKVSKSKKKIYGRNRRIAIVVVLASLLVVAVGAVAGVLIWVLMKQPQPAPSSSAASDAPATTTAAPKVTLPVSFLDANTACQNIALYDASSDTLLYTKQADMKQEPASTTKLLTAALAIQYTPEGYVFTVGNELSLVRDQSSKANLLTGDKLDLDKMLKALLIPSGNDAAYTIAASIGRVTAGDESLSAADAVKKFVALMNQTAAELGMTNTHFNNPDGYPEAAHYSTAGDMLKLVKHADSLPQVREIVKQVTVTESLLNGRTCTWKSTNKLLLADDEKHYNPYVTGMKTGSGDTTYCLTVSAEKDGRRLLLVLMGARKEEDRWTDANGLLQIGFEA